MKPLFQNQMSLYHNFNERTIPHLRWQSRQTTWQQMVWGAPLSTCRPGTLSTSDHGPSPSVVHTTCDNHPHCYLPPGQSERLILRKTCVSKVLQWYQNLITNTFDLNGTRQFTEKYWPSSRMEVIIFLKTKHKLSSNPWLW